MLAWLYPPPPQLVEITRLLGKFFSLLVFIAGLLFAGNAYALDKICQVSGSSCVNIAQPFDWQKEWGKLPSEKIPFEMHEVKRSIYLGTVCTGNPNHSDISAYAIDYKGDGREAYVVDVSKYYLPYRNVANCPNRLCITENSKDFCGIWLYSPYDAFFYPGKIDNELADTISGGGAYDISTVEDAIKDLLPAAQEGGSPPCSVKECPWRYMHVFYFDMGIEEIGGIFAADWRFMTVSDYEKETDNSVIFRPFAEQFYKTYKKIDGITISDPEVCIEEAIEAMEIRALHGETAVLPNAVCKGRPSKIPGYKRASKGEMHDSRYVLRVDTRIDECIDKTDKEKDENKSSEELVLWSGFYGQPTCIKYYQFGADGTATFVDLFSADSFPSVGKTLDARMTYQRFPLHVDPEILFIDNPNVNCSTLAVIDPEKAKKECRWRGVDNAEEVMIAPHKDYKNRSGREIYPKSGYPDVRGAIAFEFTAQVGDIPDNCDINTLDQRIKEFIGSGGGGNTVQEETFYCKDIYNTSSGKTYLVPARTDRELLSFIDVANQAVLDGLSTKVLSGESGYDWYTKVIKDIRYPDTCERKLYGDTSTFEQGYWKGTIYCPSLPCDTSKTITASRRCFRSTGIEEDCQSCLSKYPDMYVPSPVSPAGNIHTGNKGKCVFQRTCYGPPCPPPPAPSGGGDGSGSGSGSGSSGWGSDWATSMTSWANSFSGTTGRTYDYSCFPPKTPITMADGSAKPIFDIKVGDMVMGFKIGSDAPLKPAKVESLSIRDAEYVKINNLEVTPEHPMQLADGKIVSVSQLNIGDKISKADGSIEEVKTIQSKAGSARVFNLYLEDADGFIADGIRVLDGKHVK